ncbi:DNA-binding response regulator [Siphonobacter sp. BAB-5405]|uniref:response regulator transcription factor n=1 Tax=Siphonobacter sp. BAB-5405 TaxID=1864825 RepID=UPI000C809A24|nr:response regulator transcription factor [Siphonobacter sp. BAB-5405]PMD96581.1 DNA-binding response regulator [Siphonobacter sp. BAB-5405]
MSKILLVEDDSRVASFVEKGLREKMFQVRHVTKGYEAIEECMQQEFDAIILDIMLPDLDGFDVCRTIRRREINVPIIMLSALNTPEEKIQGLEAGADDYLGKPFNFLELIARINAQLRRKSFEKGNFEQYTYHDLSINLDRHVVKRGETEITLSPREFKLLLFFMQNKERVVTRAEIAEAAWDLNFDTNTNVVDVYINYLRNKLDKGYDTKFIQTIKGRGYLFEQYTEE